jgi:sporulation protein YlmC with PRC-barrel domain
VNRTTSWDPPDWHHARHLGQNRLLVLLSVIVMVGLMLVVVYPRPVLSQGVSLVKVDVGVVAQGYRASKLIGSNVLNDKNEKVGSIDELVIDKKNVLFAVLQVGGFLGIGSRLVAVPFDTLKLDETGRRIELPGASKDQLQALTEFKYRS